MSDSNEQVSDVTSENITRESNETAGPAPNDEIQEVNKLENGEEEDTIAENIETPTPSVPALKRNVSFASEGAPVLGYMEPPDPWRDVPPWTSKDLVTAYKTICEQYGIKPLNKVIQQLQAVENIGERYETLSLKGEKLDGKQVECLEEIFRRVQFRTIDVEACHLDDETAVALFDMIEYYESACKVNISFNKNISFRGWQSCARLIRKTPCLTYLDARNCEINDRTMPILGRSLRMGCFLTTLHLENANLSGRPLIVLVAALKMNEILKELFLADNKLFPTDGIQLGNLLKYNHFLQLLDLRNNHLQNVGVGHICDGVYEQNLGSGLLTLVLWNNQLTYQAMSALSKALASGESLETLNLGHNSVTNEGIHLLKDGLLKSKSILRIGLQGTRITCEGAVALAEAIADSPRLLRLDLRENDIKTAGLMALSLALKVNETVVRLDLDKDTKRESGVKDYADQQRRLQQDINSFLDRNVQLCRQRDEEERLHLERKMKEGQSRLESETVVSNENVDISNKDVAILCTFDKIKRPKLLLMPETCAERELDSPCVTENLTSLAFPEMEPSSAPDLLNVKSIPPAELLLSPQYCPEVKAKKLFSVSKVLSPASPTVLPSNEVQASTFPVKPVIVTSTVGTVTMKSDTNASISHTVARILSPASSSATATFPTNELPARSLPTHSVVLTPTLDSVHSFLPSSGPPFVQLDTSTSLSSSSGRDLSTQILNSQSETTPSILSDSVSMLIQNMMVSNTFVDELNALSTGNASESDKFSDWSDRTTADQSDPHAKSDSGNEILNNQACSEKCDINKNTEMGKVRVSRTNEVSSDTDIGNDLITDVMEENDDVFEENLQFEVSDSSLSSETKVLADNNVVKVSEQSSNHTWDSESPSVKCANNIENESENVLKNEIQNNSDIGDISKSITANVNVVKPTDSDQKDSGIGSYENELWTKIDKTEYSNIGNTSSSDNSKPNFHTTLTMNGLTQELASVLENMDDEGVPTSDPEILTPPDEFERELDQLLADVKTGSNIPIITDANLTISNSLNKSPEEILQEALECSGCSYSDAQT